MKFAGIEVTPNVGSGLWFILEKRKNVELEIKNLGNHSVRISSILTDLDKVEVRDIETNKGKTPIRYPFVIPKGQSRKISVKIRLSLKEWFWSGMNLCKVPLQICANGAFNPEDAKVFACKARIQGMWWLTTGILVIVCGIVLHKFLFFPQSNYDVSVSSEPQGQRVIVGENIVVTTPTFLKLDGDEQIQLGDSGKHRVKNVLEDDRIFFKTKSEIPE